MARQRNEATVAERPVQVGKGENVVVVRASGHSWVALAGEGGEIAREQSGGPEASFGVAPGAYVVRSDGKISAVEARTVELPGAAESAALRLTSDAKDEHPVDGVGELPADGQSFATITIEKLGADGEPLTRRRDDDEVFLRTTGGTLQDERGRPLRSVRLSSGRGRFRLVSEAAARVVTVEALAPPPLAGAELRLEFV